jgi:hypothetical protein
MQNTQGEKRMYAAAILLRLDDLASRRASKEGRYNKFLAENFFNDRVLVQWFCDMAGIEIDCLYKAVERIRAGNYKRRHMPSGLPPYSYLDKNEYNRKLYYIRKTAHEIPLAQNNSATIIGLPLKKKRGRPRNCSRQSETIAN